MIEANFVELKRLAKSLALQEAKVKAVLMGDCATQHLATAIRGASVYYNNPIQVVDIDYNLIDAQILDKNSELYSSAPNFTIIFMCTEKLQQAFYSSSKKESFAEDIYQKKINI